MSIDTRHETGYLRAMNAVVRENYEVSMLTDEAIEVHLASLNAGQDELRKDVRELRADNKSLNEKIDSVQATLNDKIDALGNRLDRKIDEKFDTLDKKIDERFGTLDRKIDEKFGALDKKIETLDNKIDAKFGTLDNKIDGVNTSLGEKITQLSNDVASMRGMQVATLWLISVLGSLGIVGKFMQWF